MGKDSYFAATLVGKIIRKIAIQKYYASPVSVVEKPLSAELKEFMQQLFDHLRLFRNELLLEKEELLTTLLLLLLDTKANTGIIFCIGDGVLHINGKLIEIDQDNIPDYLGYHVGKDFEPWFSSQPNWFTFDEIKDVSIATDGILTFKNFDSNVPDGNIDPIDFLLHNTEGSEHASMLKNKTNLLERNFGLKPGDDLGMIRVIA